jgi:hypothetical protein
MSQTGSVWLVLALGALLANLPFFTERLFLLVPRAVDKSLALRLLELVAYYFIVGGAGLALEARIGQIAAQRWEFYAVTVTLFLTLAFPGFIYRYLWKHRH